MRRANCRANLRRAGPRRRPARATAAGSAGRRSGDSRGPRGTCPPRRAKKVAVGRRHDAHVDLARPRAAHGLELALLQHAQELGLQVDGQLADLVEEDGAAVRQREAPVALPVAPVNAPLSWPKNSLSMRVGGIAAQLTFTSGLSRRPLAACSARATSSLPVPVSPRMRTVVSVGATWCRSRSTWARRWLRPLISPARPISRSSSRRYSVSSVSERIAVRPRAGR